MKMHKAQNTSVSNEALEISHIGQTVKEEDSSSEEEFSEEAANDLYRSKLQAATTSQEVGGQSETGQDGELYEPSTEDGDEDKIEIKDHTNDLRSMFDDSSDDE